ncbi:MAG: Calx-beta domain-containing protein [Xenococcaceae cyanobacterium]
MVSSNRVEGNLTSNDFILDSIGGTPIRADEFELDLTGAVGQNVTISLSSTDDGFDPFLEVLDPVTGQILKLDDNDGGGNNAQINNADNLTVPNDGKLRIRVTNANANPALAEENPYTLDVSVPTDNIEVQLQAKETIFGDPQTGSSTTVNSQLNTDDFNFTRTGFITRADEYQIETTAADQNITIGLTRESGSNADYDPFLQVINADTGVIVADSDDDGGNLNALISPGQPSDGTGLDDPVIPNQLQILANVNYIIRVTSFNNFPQPNQAQAVDYKLEVSVPQGEVTVSPRITPVIPDITISDAAIAEGNNGDTTFSFDVLLSEASDIPVTVNYATSDDTAIAGNDYTAIANGELTFEPGETTKTIEVQATGDTDAEADETFFVNLTAATNAHITDAQGVGTIQDDDTTAPEISINDVNIAEGDNSIKDLEFKVSLSNAGQQPITVDYTTVDNTALAGSDYTSTQGTLTIEAGATEKTIVVPIIGDTNEELKETFFVDLSNPSNAVIKDGRGVGTIDNDDGDDPTALELTGGRAQIAYVAYYGRPADDGGLNFWNDVLTDSGISYAPREGDRLTGNEQETYDRIVNQFGNSEEADRLFGDLSDREKLNQVYQFTFNRDGDEGGLNFWQEQLDLGNVTIATFAMEVALGAQNEDITILNNKIASADLFSESIDTEAERNAYSGSTGEIFGREWLDDYGDAISTQAQVDAALADLVDG